MKVDAFADFFEALHGHPPFPWQRRLARQVAESGDWPRVIDLPTGAGKTACIDIALFNLLHCAAARRTGVAARRIVFVVDRRIIVDEAETRASRISRAIREAKTGILAEAASLLQTLSGEPRIQVFALRGGVPREKNLVRDPSSVSVVLSTVDQIGSRLLFRGYGVTDSAKPMHAGMFGFDTLVLLDEAHIAEPFRKTLAALTREQSRATDTVLGVQPLRWTQLSATPSERADFSLDDEDRGDPVLRQRLQAKKPMRLIEVAKRDDLPRKFVELVSAELGAPAHSTREQPRIGIVVNRVATARDIHLPLKRAFAGSADVHLLIGRTRPLDRDQLMNELAPGLKASTEPRPGERPIIVVATQTIEVGADFDFHTMFIEAASYAAIRQRVGRLNRLGLRDTSRGAVILVKAGSDEDPVYGGTIRTTWALLQQASSDGSIDLGIDGAPAAELGTAVASPRSPELTPSVVRLFAQTNPRPATEPDVAQFLHGFVDQKADVSVVWREGIYDASDRIDEEIAKDVLDALPPLAVEAMSLPISGFRSWVRSWSAKRPSKIVDTGDIEGDTNPPADDGSADDPIVVVFTDEEPAFVPASQVRPGDVVVVPCHRGGADRYGFAPESTERVSDLSLAARKNRRVTIAFTPDIAARWARDTTDEAQILSLRDTATQVIEHIESHDLGPVDARDAVFEWVDEVADQVRDEIQSLFSCLRSERHAQVDALRRSDGECGGIVARSLRPKLDDLVDDRFGLQRTVDVGLDEHLRGVAAYAEQFARRIGLAPEFVENLRLAGRLHDLGKADPRFQAMLGADSSRLLAKGRIVDRRVELGARHECYSVALIDRHPALLETAPARDLVRYLVGTHHGRGRGLQPFVHDVGTSFDVDVDGRSLAFRGRAELACVDSGWADLFGRLQKQYGAWGLAYLETILRLADHRRSEDEVEESTEPRP